MNSSNSEAGDLDNSSTMLQLQSLWRTVRTTGAALASKRSNTPQSMINHVGLCKARKKRKRPANTRSSIAATNAKTSRMNSGSVKDACEVVTITSPMGASTPAAVESYCAHIQSPWTSPKSIERTSEDDTFCEKKVSDRISYNGASKDEMLSKSIEDGLHSNQNSTVQSTGPLDASTTMPYSSGPMGRYRSAKSLALFSISTSKKPQLYSESTVNYLNKWLDEHQVNPFPTNDEKLNMMAATGLSETQLDGWLCKARKKRKQMAHSTITVTEDKAAPTINQSCIPAYGTSLAKRYTAGANDTFKMAKNDKHDKFSLNKCAELSENPLANWVQCDNPSCLKWRKLPQHVIMDLLPEQFFCEDNIWTGITMSCNVPEDEWDTNDVTIKCDTNIVQVYHTGGK